MFKLFNFFPVAYLNDDMEYANPNVRALSVAIDMICLIILLKFCSGIFRWLLLIQPISIELADKIKFRLTITEEELALYKIYIIKILLCNLLQIITSIVAIILFYIKFQTSPGAWILKIKLLDERTMQTPTLKKFCKRLACFLLNILTLGLGYIMMRFTKKRQGLHDKMTNTIMVKARRCKGYIKLFASNNEKSLNIIDRLNRKIVSFLPKKIQKFFNYLIK